MAIRGRKIYIALGGIVMAIVAGELLSRQVISRRATPAVSPWPPVELLAPIVAGPPANPKRLPAGFSPLGDAQLSGKSTLTIKNGTEYDALVKAMMLVDGKPSMVRNFYVPAQSDWTEEKMPPRQRLQNKIALLKNLKSKGIWLVVASIVALYSEGKKVPDMAEVLRK